MGAIRPKVHADEVARAVERIAKRRAKVEDPNREKLPDSPNADPREVLDYLRQFSGPAIPRWVLQADISDRLILTNCLWWDDQRRELEVLRAGRALGIPLKQLGGQLGLGKQGVRDRRDRLEALMRHDRPDEKLTRLARRAAREARDRSSAEVAWLAAHREEVFALIAEVVEQADAYGVDAEDREWVDELAIDRRDGQLSPATMVMLGLAAAELRTAEPIVRVVTSARPNALQSVLTRADRLRAEFAEVGTRSAGGHLGSKLVG